MKPKTHLPKGHIPRKRFGQNFLQDPGVIQDIVNAIHSNAHDQLIEIGPGLGALTRPFLERGVKLAIIELDRDLADKWRSEFKDSKKLTVYQSDALAFDFSSLAMTDTQSLRVFGNLPYNISTPLIFHLLSYAPLIVDMHFMLQKEVVDRLTATPNHKAYGRLSVMVQYFCKATELFTVEPEAFYPKPKVRSAVIRLEPYATPPYPAISLAILTDITRAAFNQRRKTLHNTLKSYLSPSDFINLNIDPGFRAEQLSLEQFVQIANYIAQRGEGSER